MKIASFLNNVPHVASRPIAETIERLTAAGFEALDFSLCEWCVSGRQLAGDEWKDWIEGAASAAERCNIRFTQAHAPWRWNDEMAGEHLLRLCRRSIEAAGMLGIRWVVFHPETVNGAWDAEHVESLRQGNEDWFRQLIPTAEKANVGIAIENMVDMNFRQLGYGRAFGSIPAELIGLVDSLNHPLVGICWDTGHAMVQKIDQAAALRAVGPRLKALHIHDNDGNSDQHLAPYLGRIDWPSIMSSLADIRYAGDFTFETGNPFGRMPEALLSDSLRLLYRLGCSLREIDSRNVSNV